MKWTELYNAIIEFNSEIIPNWRELNPIFFSNALAGEVGEVCNLTKKLSDGGTNKLSKSEILDKIPYEIADCFAYLIGLSENLGLDEKDLLRAIEEKHLIVKKRILGD